jgi:uncharacterized SAM-binding protein YcdF (DUF218 family)
LFFVLSKTLGLMLLPTNFLIGVGLLGAMLLATRFASLGRKLVVASVLLLAICGFSPLGKLLLYPLESRFAPWDAARGAPDGVIVLGGSIDPDLSLTHGAAVIRSAADRIPRQQHLRINTRTPALFFQAETRTSYRTTPRRPISPAPYSKASALPKHG